MDTLQPRVQPASRHKSPLEGLAAEMAGLRSEQALLGQQQGLPAAAPAAATPETPAAANLSTAPAGSHPPPAPPTAASGRPGVAGPAAGAQKRKAASALAPSGQPQQPTQQQPAVAAPASEARNAASALAPSGQPQQPQHPPQQQQAAGAASKARQRSKTGADEDEDEDEDGVVCYFAAVRAIPKGETRTYAEVAQAAGKPPGCSRMVGKALRTLDIQRTKVPWWRVVTADGAMHAAGPHLAPIQLQHLRNEGARPEAGECHAGQAACWWQCAAEAGQGQAANQPQLRGVEGPTLHAPCHSVPNAPLRRPGRGELVQEGGVPRGGVLHLLLGAHGVDNSG
jgi:alkylated DNA nucleotide flippase Atl1